MTRQDKLQRLIKAFKDYREAYPVNEYGKPTQYSFCGAQLQAELELLNPNYGSPLSFNCKAVQKMRKLNLVNW